MTAVKDEIQCSDPKNSCKMLGIMILTCNQSVGEDRKIPETAYWPGSLAKSLGFRLSEKLCLKK